VLQDADIVIAEVSTPSLGVGYEIGLAEKLGKKIICLYKEGSNKSLSAMINGNKNLIVKKYKTKKDLFRIIDKIFNK